MIMKSMSSAALALLLFVSLPARAQQAPQKIDVSRLGPQAGQAVPDFRLQDAQGKVWTRDSIMGPKGAMLVFSRSVDWCPYCKTQVIELQSRLGELKAQGLGLAVITYDSPAILADFSRRRGITFPLLSDPGSQTIKAYGILNTTVAAGTSNYGIPFPGTFLIDRAGKVTSRFFEEAYQERNTISTIMIALGNAKTPAAAKRIETDHLEITSYVSDEVVAPGSLFSVVFDVKPTPAFMSTHRVRRTRSSTSVLTPTRSWPQGPCSIRHRRCTTSNRSTSRCRVPEAISTRAERGDEHVAGSPGRSEGRRDGHHFRRARLSGLRRSSVFHTTLDPRLLHRQGAAIGYGARDGAEMRPRSAA
jgi:peroxiredoxin